MPVDPKSLNDADALCQLMTNAERLGDTALARSCRARIFELAGINYEDPIDRGLWSAIVAYEDTLLRKHGKKQQASYTRRKVKEKGAITTLSDWCLGTRSTSGFEALVKDGLVEFTGEYVVLQNEGRFPREVVEAARARLADYEIDLPGVVSLSNRG